MDISSPENFNSTTSHLSHHKPTPSGVVSSPSTETSLKACEQLKSQLSLTIDRAEPSASADNHDNYPTEEQLRQLETLMHRMNRSLRYEVDEESGEQIVFIIDKQSGDVIRQIPAQELLELNQNLAKYAPGSLSQKV